MKVDDGARASSAVQCGAAGKKACLIPKRDGKIIDIVLLMTSDLRLALYGANTMLLEGSVEMVRPIVQEVLIELFGHMVIVIASARADGGLCNLHPPRPRLVRATEHAATVHLDNVVVNYRFEARRCRPAHQKVDARRKRAPTD